MHHAGLIIGLGQQAFHQWVPIAELSLTGWLLVPLLAALATVFASTGFLEAGDAMRRPYLESPPLAGTVFFLCATAACWITHLVLPWLFGSYLGPVGTALAVDLGCLVGVGLGFLSSSGLVGDWKYRGPEDHLARWTWLGVAALLTLWAFVPALANTAALAGPPVTRVALDLLAWFAGLSLFAPLCLVLWQLLPEWWKWQRQYITCGGALLFWALWLLSVPALARLLPEGTLPAGAHREEVRLALQLGFASGFWLALAHRAVEHLWYRSSSTTEEGLAAAWTAMLLMLPGFAWAIYNILFG